MQQNTTKKMEPRFPPWRLSAKQQAADIVRERAEQGRLADERKKAEEQNVNTIPWPTRLCAAPQDSPRNNLQQQQQQHSCQERRQVGSMGESSGADAGAGADVEDGMVPDLSDGELVEPDGGHEELRRSCSHEWDGGLHRGWGQGWQEHGEWNHSWQEENWRGDEDGDHQWRESFERCMHYGGWLEGGDQECTTELGHFFIGSSKVRIFV